MKYYIIAGEASGDLHGSNLMKGLKIADSNADFRIWGGELMEAEGGKLVKHYKETAVMGFAEVLFSINKIIANLRLCKRDLVEYNPDLIILIDYPGFNFRIARFARKREFKIFYYIPPKVWAWKKGRIEILKRDTNRIFTIFPFEAEHYKKRGVDVIYKGNPLLDSVAQAPAIKESEEEFRKRVGLDERPIIGLLAGSRTSEINYLMPKMAGLEKIFPEYNFLLAGAPSMKSEDYSKHLVNSNIKLLFGETYSILRHSKVTALASGTASLEAALLDTPQVVCYGVNFITYLIARTVVKIKHVSLVNIILNQPLVKELLQYDCTTENIAREIKRLLNEKKLDRVFKNYEKIRLLLGKEGTSLKVASSMVEEYNKIVDEERYYITVETPIGLLKLTSNRDFLLEISHVEKGEEERKNLPQVLTDAKREIEEYFNNSRESFTVPIKLTGTEFQIKVWNELRKIPYGEVKSYGDIAKTVGIPDASRAVGLACKMNPILIMVPCHRILGANNKLTGFAIGVEKKSYLLNHEKAYEKGADSLFKNLKTDGDEED